MIKIKLETNRWNHPIFYLKVSEEEKNNVLLKRAIIESTKGKDGYDYKVPIRYFLPIYKNYPKNKIELSKKSIDLFLEFTDDFGEIYKASTVATPAFMKHWRDANCPNIYKVSIEKDNSIRQTIAFKRVSGLIK
ncbi:MAG: hypothetical protein ACRC7N_12510 [Clostridium sp.]